MTSHPSIDIVNTGVSTHPNAMVSDEHDQFSSLLLGPVGPPWSGMETATAGLFGALRLLGPVSLVDISFSSSNTDRGRVSLRKMRHLVQTMLDLRRRRSDVAHVPISQNVSGLVRDICLLACISMPVIAYLHGGAYATILREGGLRALLLRRAFARVAGVACLYEAQCAELHEVGITQPMAAVGNAISDSWFPSRSSNDPHDPFRVLFLGLLSRSKGFDVLCAAVDGTPEISVTAVGEWHHRDRNLKLGDLATDFEVPRNVSVCTPVDRSAIPGLLANHDVLVLPSHSEGLPMTVLEAMNAGLPVLASRAGGLCELVDGGYIGALPMIDPEHVRQGLLEVRSTYGDAMDRADSARQFVRRRYSEEAIAQRVLGLVEQAGCFGSARPTLSN
jgi:polysaccharide biosynthesis protein VpsI